jgi:hypothetical protein
LLHSETFERARRSSYRMINNRLLQPLRQPRDPREPSERRRHGRRRGLGATLRKPRTHGDRAAARTAEKSAPGATQSLDRGLPAQAVPARQPTAEVVPAVRADPEVARVRGAGGPIDQAAYACACGFQFSAAVSTTVACPHCGAGQAW